MAAEMINTVLKAENAARKEEENCQKQGENIIAAAKKKAQDISEVTIKNAQSEAELILTEAADTADGILKQAETLAKLRERKVISETEKKYSELIKKVLENIV